MDGINGSGSLTSRQHGEPRDLPLTLKFRTVIQALARGRKWLTTFLAFAVGLILWQLPPPAPLDERGIHFLASMAAAVILWTMDVFDEYIVALMLLLVWVLSGVAPFEVAVAGFSNSTWFFVLGVLGIVAGVAQSGLLERLSLRFIRRIPPDHKIYSFMFIISGLLVTPLVPKIQGRVALMSPISQSISESMRFKDRSNGSAGLALSAYIGSSQLSFMFLTGASVCLIGWNLLPEAARSQFDWGTWILAAFPSGIFTLFFLFFAVHLLFPLEEKDLNGVPSSTLQFLEKPGSLTGSLTRDEWLSFTVLLLTLLGWLGGPRHGIHAAWVALAALLIFLLTGVLDKNSLKKSVDLGFLLFFGIITSLTAIMSKLKVDLWLMQLTDPILSVFSFQPWAFLVAVMLLVYFVRFFLNKAPTVILLTGPLALRAQEIGIHPGVLLLTILMALESWFLTYQTDSYQIAYYSTEGKAFSHIQARKLMVAKFLASVLALAISVPYWRMLGFIQ